MVACNGRRMPLQPTQEAGVAVTGVRYRARRLSATLHPTVPVHAPLVFDLIDCWKNRSIGQCTYHVTAPDGRVYTARPLNDAEAVSRRMERFQVTTPGQTPMEVSEDVANPTFPLTLDLRLVPTGNKREINVQGRVS